MSKSKEKSSIEKFFDTLDKEEKAIFSSYLQKPTLESLSERFDELLKHNENKETNN